MTPDIAEDPAAPRPTAFTPAEQLLFQALRGWTDLRALGERPHAEIGPVLAHKASPRAASIFIAWIQAVEQASLRPLALCCRGCGGASLDAQRLIVACGLAPVDFETGERLLSPLLAETKVAMVLARALNAALAAAGWRLPVRLRDDRPARPEPLRTLH